MSDAVDYQEFEKDLRELIGYAFDAAWYQGGIEMAARYNNGDFHFTDEMREEFIELAAQAIEKRNAMKETILNAFDVAKDELDTQRQWNLELTEMGNVED